MGIVAAKCKGAVRIIALALAFFMGASAPAHAQDNATRLLVFGDSLVAGYGLPPGEAFPDVLGRGLEADGRNVMVINGGISGDTSAGGAARIAWALGDNPDAVIIVLGGNDALRGLPPDDMAKNLDAVLAAIASRDIPVMLTGMKAPLNMGADYAREFDAAFAMVLAKARARGDAIISYPFFLDGVALVPELNQADAIHPNQKGVAEIVARILPSVHALLDMAAAG